MTHRSKAFKFLTQDILNGNIQLGVCLCLENICRVQLNYLHENLVISSVKTLCAEFLTILSIYEDYSS